MGNGARRWKLRAAFGPVGGSALSSAFGAFGAAFRGSVASDLLGVGEASVGLVCAVEGFDVCPIIDGLNEPNAGT